MNKRQLNDLKVFLVFLGIAALIFFSNDIFREIMRLLIQLINILRGL